MIGNAAAGVFGLPVLKPVVTGGTLSSDATFYYRAFTGNGTLTVSDATLTADFLVIAGGGGGGFSNGGGGGAGGLVYTASQSVSPNSYTVTVGSGGAGAPSPGPVGGTNGVNSNVTGGSLSLTAATGGGAGGASNANGSNGGSGGGGGNGRTAGTASPSGQGNRTDLQPV